MEYWLLNYGTCPSGWEQSGSDCWKNGWIAEVPDFPITQLDSLWLFASATVGGSDSAQIYTPDGAYTAPGNDSVLNIGEVWNKAEFNVVGDAGGSEAVFNSRSSIKIIVALEDGSNSAPTCLANAGTTGETNNLNLGSCSTSVLNGVGLMEFTESN
jgi:hypothetical protein